jgi:O-antigen/teichoic acid export membrane protein
MLAVRKKYPIKFRETVAKVWRFVAGVSGTTLMAIIFMQVDKIVVSKCFSLKQFAYYSLASSLAATVYKAVAPVTGVMMPRFTELIALNDEKGLTQNYHHACQLISFLIMPAVGVGVLFSHEILNMWTRDVSISDNTYVILSLLLIGFMLNSLYHIPYNLQLAYGWNRLGLYSTGISALLVVPMSIIAAMKLGLVGPAAVWLVFNFCYISIVIPIMHRRILKAEMKVWYLKDIILPLICSFPFVLFWRVLSYLPSIHLFGYLPHMWRTLPFIILALMSGYAAAAYLSALIRGSIKDIVLCRNGVGTG